MAYYAATYNGKLYVNRDLLKAAYKVGDAGVLDMLADGTIAQCCILDRVVYQISGWKRDEVVGMVTVYHQNFDEQVKHFTSKPFCQAKDAAWKVKTSQRTYQLEGMEFIRLQDIEDATRYRLVRKLPFITFFGRKYVAVNVAVGNKEVAVITSQS